jgi:hypothetical protein
MTSQNQPWLSFTLFTRDYVMKEMPVNHPTVTQSVSNPHSLSPFVFRQEVHIHHGMSNFLPLPLLVILDSCIPKGVPALFRWLSKKYPKIGAFFYIGVLASISFLAQSARSLRKRRQRFKMRTAMTWLFRLIWRVPTPMRSSSTTST